ncbi:acid protease [Didymella exigua CBS 183.55]|uniref:Acid protease n=1 Tax=Didymella exigua CBS 183.55 TaxID=1150837 RepID=A0A6A5RBU1_9PLEO|nr:acid protease [Didymella exigua CBS 183.55]KAF1924750.1 acid protease [Didymella exigua CBS 183.55]
MNQSTGLTSPLVVPNSGRWIGNDGSWSSFLVQVGKPPQFFHDCEPQRMNITDCGTKRGIEVFDSKPSPGFQRNRSSTWKEVGVYRMGLGANLGLTSTAYYGYDNIRFGSNSDQNATQSERSAVAAYATPEFWVGQLGLSPSSVFLNETNQAPSFLKMLKDEGKIPSLSFEYQAGSPNRLTRVADSLVLGGYDRSRQTNMTLLVPLNPDAVVGMQSISIQSINGPTTNIPGNGIKATIDTNTPDVWLPTEVCDTFASALGLTYFQEADRYIFNDTARSAIQSLSPTFRFVIGTSTAGGATVTIEIPYGAFDLQATYPIFATPTYYFPLRRAANESQLTFGRAFLPEVYPSVDWERNAFNISQALFNSPPLPRDLITIKPIDALSEVFPQPYERAGGSSLSIGAIVGIVIGSLGILLTLAVLWWSTMQTESEPPHTLSTDGKEVAQLSRTRTALELEGRAVKELYTPFGHYGYTENKHS